LKVDKSEQAEFTEILEKIRPYAVMSHRAGDLELLETQETKERRAGMNTCENCGKMSSDGGYTSDDVWLCMKCGTALETHGKNQAQLLEAAESILFHGCNHYGRNAPYACAFKHSNCSTCLMKQLKSAIMKTKGETNDTT